MGDRATDQAGRGGRGASHRIQTRKPPLGKPRGESQMLAWPAWALPLSRRPMIPHGSLLPLALLVGSLAACAGSARLDSPPALPEQPNLVYILADDLGYGELGSYGQEHIRTPRLDALADEGMRFTRHYSGSPVCAPSRCVLLTGLHTGHAAIRDNDEMSARGDVWHDDALEGQRPLPGDTVTMGHRLQDAGYATGFVGKWGLGGPASEGAPEVMGFDRFFGYLCQRQAHNYYPTHLWRDGQKVPLDNPDYHPHQRLPDGADPSDPASYADYQGNDWAPDLMIDEAEAFVRENSDRPFALVFASPIPHLALQVPDEDLAPYDGVFEERAYVGGAGYLPHPTPRAAYAAMISRLDTDVGRLVDLVDELGLTGRTLFVFSSDNGPSWVGGVDLEFFGSSGGLKGRKAQILEGGLRVPMVARWPGVVPAGSVSDHVSAFQDVLPTFCELAGAPAPEPCDGLSMVPALTGAGDRQPRHPFLYWEYRRRQQALVMDDWKAMRMGPDQALELYDLAADPGETTDVAADNPALVARMERLMAAAHGPSEHFELIPPKDG
jgi:arylsulfatase A-like enzyme